MNREQLLQRLDGVEWQDFELKSGAGGVPRDALRTVCAFANSGGGWLVFGVSEGPDGYEVTGLDDLDRFQNDLLAACRSPEKFHRPPHVVPRILRIGDRWVLTLQVHEATRFDKPVRVKVKGTWEPYVRVGAGDHRCSPEEEGRFLRDASLERFDQTPCPLVTVEDLDPDSAGWLQGLITLRRPEHGQAAAMELGAWLRQATLSLEDGSLTYAAALLLGNEQVIARLKPGGIADMRVMFTMSSQGLPAQRWDDRLLCEGNLVQTLRRLLERIHQLCPQPFALEPDSPHRRSRSPEEDALREALVNLVAHQDYADPSRTATILWWRDRAVFNNPGDSYVSPDRLWSGGYSEPRNPLIIRLLRQAGLAEQAGSGLPYIHRLWTDAERPAPIIHNDPARKRFEVVFDWGGDKDGVVREGVNEGVNEGINEGVNAVDDLDVGSRECALVIQRHPGLRVPQIAEHMGRSHATVERHLKTLRDRGLVTFRGAPKTGGYFLTDQDSEDSDA